MTKIYMRKIVSFFLGQSVYIYRVGQKILRHCLVFPISITLSYGCLPKFTYYVRVQFATAVQNLVNFCCADPKLCRFEDAYPLFISVKFTR